jgi:phospholipase C
MRKLTIGAVVLSALMGASVAHGQQAPPTFKHIVIIVQENQTPDDLFGGYPSLTTFISPGGGGAVNCGNSNPFEPGIDIANGGPSNFTVPPSIICFQEISDLGVLAGGDHTHYPDWETQWDNGALDGACYVGSPIPCGGSGNPKYPPYTYVTPRAVKPYYDIALSYGFANYMFRPAKGPATQRISSFLAARQRPHFRAGPTDTINILSRRTLTDG